MYIRQAQDQGLHLQAESRNNLKENSESALETWWHEEYKRRLWSSLFFWDM